MGRSDNKHNNSKYIVHAHFLKFDGLPETQWTGLDPPLFLLYLNEENLLKINTMVYALRQHILDVLMVSLKHTKHFLPFLRFSQL